MKFRGRVVQIVTCPKVENISARMKNLHVWQGFKNVLEKCEKISGTSKQTEGT